MTKDVFKYKIKIHNFFRDYTIFTLVDSQYLSSFSIFEIVVIYDSYVSPQRLQMAKVFLRDFLKGWRKGSWKNRARRGRGRARITRGQKGGEEKGGRANTKQARGDQLRNPIKVGHVSKCGAIPEVSNFLVKARKLPVS